MGTAANDAIINGKSLNAGEWGIAEHEAFINGFDERQRERERAKAEKATAAATATAMSTIDRVNSDLQGANEALAAGRAALLKCGKRIFADDEHDRREQELLRAYRETIARLQSQATEALGRAVTDFPKLDADRFERVNRAEQARVESRDRSSAKMPSACHWRNSRHRRTARPLKVILLAYICIGVIVGHGSCRMKECYHDTTAWSHHIQPRRRAAG